MLRRGFTDDIFKRKNGYRKWTRLSDDTVVGYAMGAGLYGLSPTEAWRIDGGFYDEALKRGLIDRIFIRKRGRRNGAKAEDI
jgi:hypothetical protein